MSNNIPSKNRKENFYVKCAENGQRFNNQKKIIYFFYMNYVTTKRQY